MSDFIELSGGLTVPAADIALLLDLERRGCSFEVAGETFKVKGVNGAKPELSPEEIATIKRRKAHLMALVAYQADTQTPSAP